MNRPILDWSLVAALATMLAWGMNFAFVKYVLEHLGVGAFMFLRFSILPLLGLVLLVAVFRAPTCRASCCARWSATCCTSAPSCTA
jgi:drug/metabolite transporter (DMT)-like permease